ncbi:HU family DNA-binding protein [Methylobacterium nodulans]|uniref:Histone family protein DNA-binding protein n=1 Tax=Methylobacterium nodulans (strain LMG 21967 / CNCM I-2342 / ORS 2060) TaxID=460265 RepID=B8IKW1_METNO|nr:HU family DNA-binding protein [Methylobacterium nodulans]ACL58149.1 histone family protein DNA-binding protein [Methylobacterium nodulans ORS 2060]
MNKPDLLKAIAAKAGVSEAIGSKVLAAFGDIATQSLKSGDDVPLPGLGKLVTVRQEARKGHNPRTGQPLQIPARLVPKLRASTTLHDALN